MAKAKHRDPTPLKVADEATRAPNRAMQIAEDVHRQQQPPPRGHRMKPAT